MASASSAFMRMAITPVMFAIPKEHHNYLTPLDASDVAALESAQIYGRFNVPLHLPSAHAQQ